LLQAVFAEVYELDVDEDVNKVLFALLQPLPKPDTNQSKGNSCTNKTMMGQRTSPADYHVC